MQQPSYSKWWCGIGAYATVGAPENGVIVSGKVGIGTNNPSQTLEVLQQRLYYLLKVHPEMHPPNRCKNNTDTSEINFHLSGNQEGSLIYDHDASPTTKC